MAAVCGCGGVCGSIGGSGALGVAVEGVGDWKAVDVGKAMWKLTGERWSGGSWVGPRVAWGVVGGAVWSVLGGRRLVGEGGFREMEVGFAEKRAAVGGGGGGGGGGGSGGGGGGGRRGGRDPRDPSSPEFVRGAIASTCNIAVTFPLNKLMFRQQVEDLSVQSAYRSMRVEGWRRLYRGVGPPLVQRGLSMSLMFGLYDWYYKRLAPVIQREEARSVGAALLAGSSEALLTPLERMQTILQHRHYNRRFASMWDVASKLRPNGLSEFYRGATAILLRNGPANALFFTLREPFRDSLPGKDHGASLHLKTFASGALLGAAISSLFFPLNVAKTLMQSQIGGPHASVSSTLRAAIQERNGIRGLFRGVHVNYSRSLLSWGIMNSVYEALRQIDLPPSKRRHDG